MPATFNSLEALYTISDTAWKKLILFLHICMITVAENRLWCRVASLWDHDSFFFICSLCVYSSYNHSIDDWTKWNYNNAWSGNRTRQHHRIISRVIHWCVTCRGGANSSNIGCAVVSLDLLSKKKYENVKVEVWNLAARKTTYLIIQSFSTCGPPLATWLKWRNTCYCCLYPPDRVLKFSQSCFWAFAIVCAASVAAKQSASTRQLHSSWILVHTGIHLPPFIHLLLTLSACARVTVLSRL